MRNIKLTLEYDGTPYLGWQKQKDGPSVEEELSRALEDLTGLVSPLTVAGRTDAGVHAFGQVVNFFTESAIEPARFAPALNAYLPETIRAHRSEEVSMEFSARLNSQSKRYRYRLYQGPQPTAVDRNLAWHHRAHLDRAAMHQASRALLGERDFNAFRSVHCDADHAVREMFAITFHETPRPPCGTFIDIVFHANAFCRHMCRILAGTLVDIGRGRFYPEEMTRILMSRDRREAGVTAPPHGLTLLEVIYPH